MAEDSQNTQEVESKPIHTIVLDSSPLLLNTPPLSTLLANSHVLATTPSVISEIRGEEARTRINTLYTPFLTIRSPKAESVKVVKEFARKTGDAAVLSPTDLEILALAYEFECERNGGDWRLRAVPGQKRVNGSPPRKPAEEEEQPQTATSDVSGEIGEVSAQAQMGLVEEEVVVEIESMTIEDTAQRDPIEEPVDAQQDGEGGESEATQTPNSSEEAAEADTLSKEAEDDSDDGWITPSNIKKRQEKDEAGSTKSRSQAKHLQVATMTGDFAMQNVLLQMNLNLLSTKTCQRISQIKQFILRCHACFATTKDMDKQFCARCGKPTLTRVSCTTNDKGEVKLHLKAKMQWNNRGNVFSVPKPVSGNANQKWQGPRQGGGQAGWGNGLILAEDQKEYVRAMSTMKRTKEKDLMDEDSLPNILSGGRSNTSSRPKVGGGRNINSRRR